MTQSTRNAYSDSLGDEWLAQEIQLHDADGDEIGKVLEANPDFVVAESDGGFLGLGERRLYYIPRAHIVREDADDWYVDVDKDQIESMNWTQVPAQSTFSTDWRNGQPAGWDNRPGGTRIRRYEEELQADTVQRQAGEVTVSKHVVEDTKTFEVPVRKEEVHVERRPVSGEATTGTIGDDAFTEQSISVPLMEEDVEIRKVSRPVEEIEITKTQTSDTKQVEGTVRREEFDIDDSTRDR